jgi:hypothetical protein
MIKDKLKPAIRSKRRELPSKTVLLHHDNAQPQSKIFKNSISSFFLIHPTLQTWHQVITNGKRSDDSVIWQTSCVL